MRNMNYFNSIKHWLKQMKHLGILGRLFIIISLTCLLYIFKQSNSTNSVILNSEVNNNTTSNNSQVINLLSNQSLLFEENKGQVQNNEIVFLARNINFNVLLSKQGEASLSFFTLKNNSTENRTEEEITQIRMYPEEINTQVTFEPSEKQVTKVNYLIGNEEKNWIQNGSTWSKVNYKELYPGIDLIYYGSNQDLEYDFILKPQAQPETIKLGIEGVNDISITDEGDLILSVQEKQIILRAPNIYQMIKDDKVIVKGEFVILKKEKNKVQVGFNVSDYNPNYALVIDPVLDYSSYLVNVFSAGIDDDNGGVNDIALDTSGNIYLVGKTAVNSQFPLTPGVVDRTLPTHPRGISGFIVKLNPQGSQILFATYLGGSGNAYIPGDTITDIEVDAQGKIYVAGSTSSADFPVTAGAFGICGRGMDDGFISKITPDGTTLIYSSCFGGSGYDGAATLKVNSNGEAYIMGMTTSIEYFPQLEPPGSSAIQGPYLVVVSADGKTMLTNKPVMQFKNGANAFISDMVIDTPGNNVYFTGSINFNLPPNCSGDWSHWDALFGKTDKNGNNVKYTVASDGGQAENYFCTLPYLVSPLPSASLGEIAVDSGGNFYFAGTTHGGIPSTSGAYVSPAGNSYVSVFAQKYTGELFSFPNSSPPTNPQPLFSSLLFGGWTSPPQHGSTTVVDSLAVDSQGRMYLAGYTEAPDFVTTANAYDRTYNGGLDAFLVVLNKTGTALEYATYLGGSGDDAVSALLLKSDGEVYLTGNTRSTDFPVTNNAYQTNPRVTFLVKMTLDFGSTHKICQGGSCVIIDGAGTDQCSDNSQCQHKVCQGSSCVTINSPGANTCSVDADCTGNVVARPIRYQGRVKIGNVVPQDGPHNFQFRIYTQASGGSACWDSGSLSETTSRGAFETELAVGTACSQFSGSSYWLEIAVDGPTLSPRELILPSPFTINTLTLSGFDGTNANLLGDLPLFSDNKVHFLGNTLGLPSSTSGRRLNLYNAASNNQYLVGVGTSTVYFTSPQKFSWYTTNGSVFEEKLNFNGNLFSFKGNSRFNQKVNARDGYKCGGSDLAEIVSPQKFASGTVVCISSGTNGEFTPCEQEYSAAVVGVVSENPGLLLNGAEKDGLKLALQGRVKVKATNANGPISPGDELVSSPIPGYAMKGSPSTTYPVMIVGKALESFNKEAGEILVLVK